MSNNDHTPRPPSGSTSSGFRPSTRLIMPSASIFSTSPSSSTCVALLPSVAIATRGKRREISPLFSGYPLLKKKLKHVHVDDDGIDNSSNIKFIENFLQCNFCLDFPASPIHSCPKAHVICGRCAPKFVACPTCQAPNLAPSPIADKLAEKAKKKIICPNYEAGCKEVALSTEFGDHLAHCYFREISCYHVKCRLKLQFHEYTEHLEDYHHEEMFLGPKLTEYYNYDENEGNPVKFCWTNFHSVLKFEGRDFICHLRTCKASQLFFCWVSILGDVDEANKYNAEIQLPKKKSSGAGCSWTLPVCAFHEIRDKESKEKLTEHCAVLSIPQVLKNWGESDLSEIYFRLSYEIVAV